MSFQVGAHSVHVQDDIVFVEVNGDISESEVVAILRHAEPVQDAYGYHLGMMDVHRFGRVSPEGRRYVAEWGKRYSLVGNACFGASLTARTLITLVVRAISLLQRSESALAFFKTEAEARVWLSEQRHRLQHRRVPDRQE